MKDTIMHAPEMMFESSLFSDVQGSVYYIKFTPKSLWIVMYCVLAYIVCSSRMI